MQKVNKHTVLKTARDKGHWSGWIAGNKVNEYHIVSGWSLGAEAIVTAEKIEGVWYYKCNGHTLESFENAILYYLPKELGARVAYWDGNKTEMAVYSDEK